MSRTYNNRHGLTNNYKELSASFERDGVDVEKDWRYDVFIDYLSISPSYQMTCLYCNGHRKLEELPPDHERLIQVVNDFGDYSVINNKSWWYTRGMYLFGIKAPLPKVRAEGILSSGNKRIITTRKKLDALVLSVPLILTKSQVMTQLKHLIEDYEFSSGLNEEVLPPKYSLATSKLQKKTILNSYDAFRLYLKGKPLWQIGKTLDLINEERYKESELRRGYPFDFSEYKQVLAIAASREVRRAFNIAENAARGVFPSTNLMKDHYGKEWNLGISPTLRNIGKVKTIRKPGRPLKVPSTIVEHE